MMAAMAEVRVAGWRELDRIVDSFGQAWFFHNRLERQDRQAGVLLVAWIGNQAVGDIYLWLEPAEEPPVREHLAGVPLLNHLEVLSRHQSQGIGAQLVLAAEDEAIRRGYQRIALGVGLDNIRARRLYVRLGYTDWQHGTVITNWEEPASDGTTTSHSEVVTMLVKDLAA